MYFPKEHFIGSLREGKIPGHFLFDKKLLSYTFDIVWFEKFNAYKISNFLFAAFVCWYIWKTPIYIENSVISIELNLPLETILNYEYSLCLENVTIGWHCQTVSKRLVYSAVQFTPWCHHLPKKSTHPIFLHHNNYQWKGT